LQKVVDPQNIRSFLKKNLVAKGSCNKEHSNYQKKYFSELTYRLLTSSRYKLSLSSS